MPKVSVVLPVYNGSEYLAQSIESVLNQTFQDFELIIVDDCSTDDSGLIAQKYAKADARITYIKNQTNLKLPNALNKGFACAQGVYLTWTSCDNVYLPNAFQRLLDILESEPDVALVYSSMEIIDAEGKLISFVQAGDPKDLIFRNVVGACFMYRKTIADQAGAYDPSALLCEDYEYWLRIARIGELKEIPEVLYQYRIHGNSLSANRLGEIISRGIRVQKNYYPHFIKTRRQAAMFYAHLRARDIYNPLRQLYLFIVLFYSPKKFFTEIYGLIKRRFAK